MRQTKAEESKHELRRFLKKLSDTLPFSFKGDGLLQCLINTFNSSLRFGGFEMSLKLICDKKDDINYDGYEESAAGN